VLLYTTATCTDKAIARAAVVATVVVAAVATVVAAAVALHSCLTAEKGVLCSS
jgi:hypothetical protein